MLINILCLLLLSQQIFTMFIPQDVEILDGYDLEESPEYYPQDTSYFEVKSLTNVGLTKAVRNKRSLSVEESKPFFKNQPDQQDKIDSEDITKMFPPKISTLESFGRDRRGENNNPILPIPEKQIMESDYYKKGIWNVQTYDTDYLNHKSEDEDPLAESTNNDDTKGRTPRVNFITQQKKPPNENNERQRFLPTKPKFERVDNHATEYYPSRSYDPYLRRYDRYDDQFTRYDPYYEDFYVHRRRYDPNDSYSPRGPSYPDPYYTYPDRRYDIPEPRDYRPIFTNDIYDKPPPSFYERTPKENRNRRIIYYAHLPEIVKNQQPPLPPPYDITYRYDRQRYPIYDNYNYSFIGPVSGAYKTEERNQNRDRNNAFINREKKDNRNSNTYSVNIGESSGSNKPNRNRE